MSGPPPGGPPHMSQPPPRFPPPKLSNEDLIPTAPYFDLPAGLMCPLVKVGACNKFYIPCYHRKLFILWIERRSI